MTVREKDTPRRLGPYLLLYYVLVPAVYAAVFALCAGLISLTKGQEDLGTVTAAIYGVLFGVTPAVTATLMRFSLLRLPLDPIAAAEIPLLVYAAMAVRQARHAHGLRAGILLLHAELGDDGGIGWLFLGGLFVFALLASFSLARVRGESVSFRILRRLRAAGRSNRSRRSR